MTARKRKRTCKDCGRDPRIGGHTVLCPQRPKCFRCHRYPAVIQNRWCGPCYGRLEAVPMKLDHLDDGNRGGERYLQRRHQQADTSPQSNEGASSPAGGCSGYLRR